MTNLLPKIPILYECNNYIIINKPFGVYTQPADLHTWFQRYPGRPEGPRYLLDELANTFKREEEEKKNFQELKTVHRLDVCVTGGMLLAKNKTAAINFSRNLKKGGSSGFPLKRRYVALLNDSLKKTLRPTGTLEMNGMVTKYKLFDDQCIILELITGKKHQLRKQLSSILKQPILNDVKYGGSYLPGTDKEQIALHSAYIETRVGLQKRSHIVPMIFNNNGKLWNRQYIDSQGFFCAGITKILTDTWNVDV